MMVMLGWHSLHIRFNVCNTNVPLMDMRNYPVHIKSNGGMKRREGKNNGKLRYFSPWYLKKNLYRRIMQPGE